MRLGILTSHPIQYQAPWFRELAKVVDLEVFFAHQQSAAEQGDAGFGVAFDWDVDLLSGYKHRFLRNVSARPGVNHYSGCDTPEIAVIIDGKLKGSSTSAFQSGSVSPFDAFIVCGWYLKSYLQAARACRAAGVPVLVRGDSQLRTPRSLLKRLAMEVRQRWMLRQFDGFLSVGQRHHEYLTHYGVPPDRIFFAPHFVDNEWFRARAEERKHRGTELRRLWGADGQTLVILFVGKFIAKKRPLDLLSALKVLNAQPSAWNFLAVFVGSGELGQQLRRACHVIYDGDKVLRIPASSPQATTATARTANAALPQCSFLGFKNQSELPDCYAAADVLVLPSESESWGLVLNEAMACGLPAIVSDSVGCAPDLIEEGLTGFTFPVGDVDQLAHRLAAVADMKARGHDFAPALAAKLQAYSVRAAVEGTIQALTETIEKRRTSCKMRNEERGESEGSTAI